MLFSRKGIFLPTSFSFGIRRTHRPIACLPARLLACLPAFLSFHSFHSCFIVFTVGFRGTVSVCAVTYLVFCVLAYFSGMVVATTRSCILNHPKKFTHNEKCICEFTLMLLHRASASLFTFGFLLCVY